MLAELNGGLAPAPVLLLAYLSEWSYSTCQAWKIFSYSSENASFAKSLSSCITREGCLRVTVSLCLMEKGANYSGQLWSLVDQITVTLLSMTALFYWLIIRQREVHSGMIVSEFPLESVPSSVELRFSSLPSVSALLLITDLQMGTGWYKGLCTVALFCSRASLALYPDWPIYVRGKWPCFEGTKRLESITNISIHWPFSTN